MGQLPFVICFTIVTTDGHFFFSFSDFFSIRFIYWDTSCHRFASKWVYGAGGPSNKKTSARRSRLIQDRDRDLIKPMEFFARWRETNQKKKKREMGPGIYVIYINRGQQPIDSFTVMDDVRRRFFSSSSLAACPIVAMKEAKIWRGGTQRERKKTRRWGKCYRGEPPPAPHRPTHAAPKEKTRWEIIGG